MKNIVILISGGGSNMAAIVKTAQREGWHDKLGARVAAVISNKAAAGGLVFAREHGIATEVLDHKNFASRDAKALWSSTAVAKPCAWAKSRPAAPALLLMTAATRALNL